MSFLKKRWVAVVLCVLMVAAGLWIGRPKQENDRQPETTVSADAWGRAHADGYQWLVVDEADVLSNDVEARIAAQIAATDYMHGSVCALVVVKDAAYEKLETLAFEYFDHELSLEVDDALLIMEAGNGDWWLVWDTQFGAYANTALEDLFYDTLDEQISNPEQQLPALYEGLRAWYGEYYPENRQVNVSETAGTTIIGSLLMVALIVILIVVAVVAALVRAGTRMVGRFRTGRTRPHFMGTTHIPFHRQAPGHRINHGTGYRPPAGNRTSTRTGGSRGGFGGASRTTSSRTGGFGGSGRSSGGSRGGFGGRR